MVRRFLRGLRKGTALRLSVASGQACTQSNSSSRYWYPLHFPLQNLEANLDQDTAIVSLYVQVSVKPLLDGLTSRDEVVAMLLVVVMGGAGTRTGTGEWPGQPPVPRPPLTAPVALCLHLCLGSLLRHLISSNLLVTLKKRTVLGLEGDRGAGAESGLEVGTGEVAAVSAEAAGGDLRGRVPIGSGRGRWVGVMTGPPTSPYIFAEISHY